MNHVAFFTRKPVVISLAILACFLWGSAYPAVKNGFEMFQISSDDTASKLLFAGVRFLCAGLLLLLFAAWQKQRLFAFSRAEFGRLLTLGIFMTTLQYTFFYIGLSHTTGTKGAIINAMTSFFSVLIAHFCYANDRLQLRTMLGCLLGFVGVMIININPNAWQLQFKWTGEGFVMLSALLLAVGGIYGKQVSQRMDSSVMTGWQLTFGGALLCLLGLILQGKLTVFTPASTLLLAYMVLLSSVAFTLWAALLKYNKVSTVTIFSFTVPVFGAMLSALFLQESILEWKNLLALLLVCSGIWLVTQPAK